MTDTADPKHDIFISYSHLDNNSEWVSMFRDYIDQKVSGRVGRDSLDIFIDYYDLAGNRKLDNELRRHVRGSRALFIFLSDNYLASDWCSKEIEWFEQNSPNLRSRIFIIRMQDVSEDVPRELDVLKERRGYYFYNRERKFPYYWFDWAPADEQEKRSFTGEMRKLAGDLISLLKEFQEQEPAPSSSGPRVVLSPIGFACDRSKWIDARSELEKCGATVVPNPSEIGEAFADYEKFVQIAERCSAEADLYVQIPSENFSITVPGPFKEQHIDLIEEWKFFEHHGVVCKLWCEAGMSSAGNASVDDNYRLFIDERRRNGEIVESGIAGVLPTLKHSNDIPQVCLDYKNDDEKAGRWLIDLIGNYCECFVETLSENEEDTEAHKFEDPRDQVHGVQSSIVEKLLNADFAVVLKKDRSNQQLHVV